MKKFLFVFSRPVYSGALGRESLEQVMLLAAFEQHVALLLSDDAVFQLVVNQHPDNIQACDHGKLMQALPVYGIETIYVEAESLTERGLNQDNLIQTVQCVERAQMSTLLNQFDQVINC
ncbi:MAG: sulfurtransferase complex subunit TusC [Gammaproteobacteria bacterium]|nr:sulfurtransferase complex subunit TusC [Gammaproteobacteria bacterium]